MKAIMSAAAATLSRARAAASLSQRELAQRANTAQSVVARIEGGQANPTIDTLARLLDAAGFDLRIEAVPRITADQVIEAYKRDVDRTLLRENLRRSVDERLTMNAELQELAAELQRGASAGRKRQ